MAKKHYVNNKHLYEQLVAYLALCKEAEKSGDEKPKVPEYIGECIFEIAERRARKWNFTGYAFKEDMISEAALTCLKYMHNFDPEKTQNPFAYFSQIVFNAFKMKIKKEKKALYIKYKASQAFTSYVDNQNFGEIDLYEPIADAQYIDDFVMEYEEKNNIK